MSRRRPSSTWSPRLAAGAALALAFTAEALARGGGGGNFGGGNGNGGGGGGGGDGLGALVHWLIWLVFRVPWIGVPFVILVIVLVVRKGRTVRLEYQATVIRGGANATAVLRSADLVGQVRAADPAFDPAAFDARVRTAFRKVQDAWCAQDLTSIRPFVSDGVHERFVLQIDEEKALGYRDRMDSLAIDQTRLAHVTSEGAFDAITVRIAATAADYRVSLTTGERVAGDTAARSFSELWTFLRRRGAKRPATGAGLIEGNCPNCGDSIEGNQFADCRSCKARLRSGEHDWVLVEITQAGEWSEATGRDAPGVASLVAEDPDFGAESLEDRAAVAFWRWSTAMRLGSARPMAGIAADEVVREVEASFSESPDARRYVGECGVGGVDLLGIVREEELDRALVEVRWSGTEFEARPGGAPRRLDRTGVRTWLLVFDRAKSAKSRAADSFSSAHCRGCGAPAEGAASACAYCGAALVDVHQGWTLTQWTTRNEAAGRVMLDRLRGNEVGAPVQPSVPPALVPAGVVAWAARVAASDGVVDAKEHDGLQRLAQRAGMSPTRADEVIGDAVAPGGEPPLPASTEEARAWMEFAVRTALADGVVSPEEFALLRRLAVPAGMADADVRVLVNRTRAALFQEAKAAISAASSVTAVQ